MKVFAGSRPPWFPLPSAWRAHAINTPDSVLLETAGGTSSDHVSYLFTSPEKILHARSALELLGLLNDVEAATQQGSYAAGRIDYEAAYALHDIPNVEPSRPIACFGIYRQPLRFDHHSGIVSGPAFSLGLAEESISGTAMISPPRMAIDRKNYAEKFEAVQRFLAAGDTYQVNLTTHVDADLFASPLALYEVLIDAQPVDFIAILHFGDSLTLSFSPELFFRIEARNIVTRPMKGTAPRGKTPEEDAQKREWLERDEKNHAEHVMIVDLLRNDLGRICEPGSVCAEDLFHIEPYPTLFQMTSTVSGTLHPEARFGDVIRSLFPSGSVTGAPKRRTMEIIRDLEDSPRGVYTGAIGFVAPSGDACFSVPIRTINVRGKLVSMGVGGGIVADSTAAAEYDECSLKASFLSAAARAPRLIETMLWHKGTPLLDDYDDDPLLRDRDRYTALEHHLARLSRSASQLGFVYNHHAIHAALEEAAKDFTADTRVRLLLSTEGTIDIESTPVIGPRAGLRVRIASRRILSTNPWRQHKSTRRTLYDREFARARSDGFDDVLFLNERGEVVEGAISTLFVKIGERFCTPPLSSGALPGIMRQLMLKMSETFIEQNFTLDELLASPDAYLNNAVRGSRPIGSLHIE